MSTSPLIEVSSDVIITIIFVPDVVTCEQKCWRRARFDCETTLALSTNGGKFQQMMCHKVHSGPLRSYSMNYVTISLISFVNKRN